MWEINVSHAGDQVHVGDKALMRETPVQRGRVNRYVNIKKQFLSNNSMSDCKQKLLFNFDMKKIWVKYEVMAVVNGILKTRSWHW